MTARVILIGVVVAQLADAVTFAVAVARYGISGEANSMAVWLYELGGLDGVLVAKGVAILTSIGLLVMVARRFPRVLVMGGAAATSLGLLGFVTNTTSMLVLG